MKTREFFISLLLVLLAIAATGCRFAVRERKIQSDLRQKDVALTQNQIRLRMRGLVGPMCSEIEEAANRIAAGTTNRSVQQAALEWKIEAVPVMREALFQPDPLTAAIDTWVLCFQMADYFETGPGKTALGDSSFIAAATCRRLEERIAQVEAARTASGDVSRIQAYARQWAADHPITHSIAGRESVLSRALERDAMGTLSTGEVMAEVTTTVDDLSRRLEVYSGQVVRQARWEIDLLKSDILTDPRLEQALEFVKRTATTAEQAAAKVDHLLPAVERVLETAESSPKWIASERETAIKTLQDEVARTIRFAQEERIVALAYLTQERIVALKTLDERFNSERATLTLDLDRISVKAVDHAIWRITQLVAVTLVALFIGAVLLLLLNRRLSPRVQ